MLPTASKSPRSVRTGRSLKSSPTVSVAAISEQFSTEEISHISAICQQPESAQNAPQALADYIRIIQAEAAKRAGGNGIDPLLAATEKYKDKKGTGGKQHV